MLTLEEWKAKKQPHHMIGIANISIVTVYQALYSVFLLAMLRKPFWQHSCYRIMFVLGLFDVGATLVGGTFDGTFTVRGDIFCTNPIAIYLAGCCRAPVWSGCCVTGLILLVNRAFDLIDGRYAHALFGGRKTFIWLTIPFGIFIYMFFFTTPFMYNAIYDGGFMNPYMGVPEIQVDLSEYDNPFAGNFNYFVTVAYPFMYFVLCVILWFKTRGGQSKVSTKQKQIIAQSVIVSILLAIVSASYILMQYIPTPFFLIVAVQFMWMASHGASVFTYIFINKTMRKHAGLMVKGWWFSCVKCRNSSHSNSSIMDSQPKILSFSTQNAPSFSTQIAPHLEN
ncbi:serpentine type 7TM GPCR chemoreceptor srt domain-containing protein [Ditylenchus destructor]|nr:serpentine type 7TM GPCR chemoreceptor srt domain-containing protein [Ditylenchus destructor]